MSGKVVTAGLYPSESLYPSASLYPQDTVYGGGPITPHQVALACGTGGAYVDISTYVEFGEGITYTYGRQDEFSDVQPGTFTFTLNNSDGRFTPGNTASPLATSVTEGMGVCWQLGTRLVRTRILAVEVPADEATWHHLVVHCDDMLGTAGRHMLTSIADGLTEYLNPVLWWKLDEASGATAGLEQSDAPLGAFTPVSSSSTVSPASLVTFGQTQHPALPGTAVTVTASAGTTTWFGTQHGNTLLKTNFAYAIPTGTATTYFGAWSFWVYPGSSINFAVTPYWAVGAGYSDSMQVIVTPTTIGVKGGVNTAFTHTYTSAEQTVPHYVEIIPHVVWQSSGSYWALEIYLYIDAQYLGSTFMESAVLGYAVPSDMLAAGTAMQPLEVNFSVTTPSGATPLAGTVQRVSHSVFNADYVTLEQNALYATEDERRAVLDTFSDDISSAAYNGRASLWSAPIGFPDVSNRSLLDVYNDIVRTEQGHMFCLTTGTLTSPSEQIQVRDRDRPTTPKVTFSPADEGDGLPSFVRDITNVAAQVDVAGPTDTVTVKDPTITGRYVTGGLSETVLLTDAEDLRMWGQDRLTRGKNIALRVQTFAVDAYTTPTDRSADLLGLVPGDRIQLTGLPASTLGFSTWDGWILGATESHGMSNGVGQHRFQFTLAPTLPNTGVYDTDRYENDGDGVLSVTCTATGTTLNPTTNTGAGFSTDVPYLIQIDSEQMTVTGVSAGVLTVTRGVNGTTATIHQGGAGITAVYSPVYAF